MIMDDHDPYMISIDFKFSRSKVKVIMTLKIISLFAK